MKGNSVHLLTRTAHLSLTAIRVLAATLIGVLIIIVGGSVILRVFGVVPAGSTELATLIFVWAIYIGAFLAFVEGGHLAITFASDRLRGRVHTASLILASLLTLVFTLMVTLEGYKYVQLALDSIRVTPSLHISPAWQYAAVVVGMALSSIYLVLNIAGNVVRFIRGEDAPRQATDDDIEEKLV